MCISTRPPGPLWGVPVLQTSSAVLQAWPQPVALTDADLVCAGVTHVVRGCLCARGVDVVFDAVGAATVVDDTKALKTFGLLVSFGGASGPAQLSAAELRPKTLRSAP